MPANIIKRVDGSPECKVCYGYIIAVYPLDVVCDLAKPQKVNDNEYI